MNDCLRRWIEQRSEEGSNDVRVYLWIPEELSDLGWEFEHALRMVLEERYGFTDSSASVSTTCGASDVAFSLGVHEDRVCHIYIETPGRYPL